MHCCSTVRRVCVGQVRRRVTEAHREAFEGHHVHDHVLVRLAVSLTSWVRKRKGRSM